jgi:hypothetical protein
MDIYKQIKNETDVEYLTQLEKYVDMDISNIGSDSEKMLKIKADMIGVTPEKYLENQRDTFTKLKETIQKRIKTLNSL